MAGNVYEYYRREEFSLLAILWCTNDCLNIMNWILSWTWNIIKTPNRQTNPGLVEVGSAMCDQLCKLMQS